MQSGVPRLLLSGHRQAAGTCQGLCSPPLRATEVVPTSRHVGDMGVFRVRVEGAATAAVLVRLTEVEQQQLILILQQVAFPNPLRYSESRLGA